MYADQITEIEEALERIDAMTKRQVLLRQLWKLRRRQETHEAAKPTTSGIAASFRAEGAAASEEPVRAMVS